MRLAETVPVACAGCFDQKVRARHVDFESAWDGPMVNEDLRQAIDDLILCEDCIRQAGKLVGIGDVEQANALEEEALERAEQATARAQEAESKLSQVAAVFASLGVPEPDYEVSATEGGGEGATEVTDDAPGAPVDEVSPYVDLSRDELVELLKDRGVDYTDLEGSGDNGRVLKTDMVAALEAGDLVESEGE